MATGKHEELHHDEKEEREELSGLLKMVTADSETEAVWRGGTPERNHMATSNMLCSITKEGSDKERYIIPARMCDVENSMMDRSGRSPNKVVLGQISKMPYIRRDEGARELQRKVSLTMMRQCWNMESGQQQTQPRLVRGGD